MNYTELVSVMQDYLQDEEDSFLDNIDVFIKLAEKRIHLALRLPAQRQYETTAFTASNRFLTLPSDTLAVLSIEYTNSSSKVINLLRKEKQFIREAYPTPTSTGAPLYYAIYDHDTALIGPTPDSSYNVEISYDGFPTSITSAGTTWVGDNLERLLLYGVLLEGYIYMKGEEDLTARYQAEYDRELEKASLKNIGMAYGPDETKRGASQ